MFRSHFLLSSQLVHYHPLPLAITLAGFPSLHLSSIYLYMSSLPSFSRTKITPVSPISFFVFFSLFLFFRCSLPYYEITCRVHIHLLCTISYRLKKRGRKKHANFDCLYSNPFFSFLTLASFKPSPLLRVLDCNSRHLCKATQSNSFHTHFKPDSNSTQTNTSRSLSLLSFPLPPL